MRVDSYVSPLLSLTHEIHQSFDCNEPVDVRETLLKVIKRIRWFAQTNSKLSIFSSADGQTFSWKNIYTGVPQGSGPGHLQFLNS